MTKKSSHFDAYGRASRGLDSYTEMSGRYAIQKNAERNIVPEIIQKLNLNSDDSLLEIGCGVGNLLVPLSFHVSSCTGIDHKNLTDKIDQRFKSENLLLIGEDFLKVEMDALFDKILVYSVLLLMPDLTTLHKFVDKALSLLKPTGRMLLGDINNIDLKNRFLSSNKGESFQQKWDEEFRLNSDGGGPSIPVPSLEFNDKVVMDMLLYIRSKGFNSSLVEQSKLLPFGHTREDIIVAGPES
jgi:2-polyprenyl-3-methyl-5-hydroxy-6-metoxy-1,4-benzoquinol methylase